MDKYRSYTENGEQKICEESTEMNTTRKEETWMTKRNMEKENRRWFQLVVGYAENDTE